MCAAALAERNEEQQKKGRKKKKAFARALQSEVAWPSFRAAVSFVRQMLGAALTYIFVRSV